MCTAPTPAPMTTQSPSDDGSATTTTQSPSDDESTQTTQSPSNDESTSTTQSPSDDESTSTTQSPSDDESTTQSPSDGESSENDDDSSSSAVYIGVGALILGAVLGTVVTFMCVRSNRGSIRSVATPKHVLGDIEVGSTELA